MNILLSVKFFWTRGTFFWHIRYKPPLSRFLRRNVKAVLLRVCRYFICFVLVPIDASEKLRIVGVVGIGHVVGITKLWPTNQHPYLKDILTIPPPSLSSKVIKITFRISLLTIGGYLIYRYVPVPKALKTTCENLVHKVLVNVRQIQLSPVKVWYSRYILGEKVKLLYFIYCVVVCGLYYLLFVFQTFLSFKNH